MELACDDVIKGHGCEFVASAEDAAALHSEMMGHGTEAHSDMLDGLAPADLAARKDEMETHIHSLIAHIR